MTEDPRLDPTVAGIEVMRRHTGKGLPEARAERILLEVLAGREIPIVDRSPWRLQAFGFAAALTASLVVVTGVYLLRRPSAGPPEVVHVVYRSGRTPVWQRIDGSLLPADATASTDLQAEVGTGGRLDLALGSGTRLSATGGARLQVRTTDRVTVATGVVSFAVAPQAKGRGFVVNVGDTELSVHGTRFAVTGLDGDLCRVDVDEGVVEVRPAPPATATLLSAGQRFVPPGRSCPRPPIAAELFDTVWWKEAALSGTGHLALTSDPVGAEVDLDGGGLGRTPIFVQLPARTSTVVVKLNGYAVWRRSLAIKPGEVVALSAALLPLPAARLEEPDAPVPEVAPHRPARDPFAEAENALRKRDCAGLKRLVPGLLSRADSADHKADVEMLLAECHVRSGAKKRALEIYERVNKAYAGTPSAETALFESSKLLSDLGERERALTKVEEYLSAFPSGAFADPAQFRRCEVLVAEGRLVDGEHCLSDYRRRFPKGLRTKESSFLLANIARVSGRWSEAAGLFATYLEGGSAQEHREDALYLRGACLARGHLPGLADAAARYLSEFPRGKFASEVEPWTRP